MNMQIFQCYINENVRIFRFFLVGFFFFFLMEEHNICSMNHTLYLGGRLFSVLTPGSCKSVRPA